MQQILSIEVLGDSYLCLSRRRRLDWRGRNVARVDSLVDLVCEGVSMEDNYDLLDPFKLGRKCPYVHSYVFRKDRGAERCSQMILDEDLSVVLDVYLVD